MINGEGGQIAARSVPEGDGRAGVKAPEQAADETEYVVQGQQTQQGVVSVQRQHLVAVPGARAEALLGQHDGLGGVGRAGGEEQQPAASVPDALGQIRGGVEAERILAPELVDIRIADQLGQLVVGKILVQQNDLHPGRDSREDCANAREASVAEHAEAGFSGSAPAFRLLLHALSQLAVGTMAAGGKPERAAVGEFCGVLEQKLLKRVVPHQKPSFLG